MNKIELSPEELIRFCYQCGKCTGVCPLGDVSFYSPRILIHDALLGRTSESVTRRLAQCSTCDLCSSRCPMDIKISEFVREERHKLRDQGVIPEEAHFGIFSTLARLMATQKVKPNLNDYFTDEMEFSDSSKVLIFTGCMSIFETYFEYEYTEIAKSAVKILNYLGIKPQLLKGQVCCGHDLFWGGDYENFKKLGEQNIKMIEDSGAELVITVCPECYRTFQLDYPRFIKQPSFNVISFTEFLDRKRKEGVLDFPYESPATVTYQDPCRLGRQMGVYDAPRNLLKAIPGVKLKEMERNRENALCCGVSAWMNCNLYSKALRMDRLDEAQKTAELLITNCPHCLMHFNCLKNEYSETELKYKLDIMDLKVFIAKALLLG